MTQETLRADRWLWFTRLFKSRTLAAEACVSGRIRLNGTPVRKANQALKVGDVLTFPQLHFVRVIRVTMLGTRRGPATEAQTLYEDLAPVAEQPRPDGMAPTRDTGAGRPTKAERRATDRLRDAG